MKTLLHLRFFRIIKLDTVEEIKYAEQCDGKVIYSRNLQQHYYIENPSTEENRIAFLKQIGYFVLSIFGIASLLACFVGIPMELYPFVTLEMNTLLMFVSFIMMSCSAYLAGHPN